MRGHRVFRPRPRFYFAPPVVATGWTDRVLGPSCLVEGAPPSTETLQGCGPCVDRSGPAQSLRPGHAPTVLNWLDYQTGASRRCVWALLLDSWIPHRPLPHLLSSFGVAIEEASDPGRNHERVMRSDPSCGFLPFSRCAMRAARLIAPGWFGIHGPGCTARSGASVPGALAHACTLGTLASTAPEIRERL